MSFVILKPQYVAPECFLAEARNWLAFYRFPLQMLVNDSLDFRFDPESQEDYEARYISQYEFEFDEFECNRLGLPLNPEIEAYINNCPPMEPEHYEKMLEHITDEKVRAEYAKEYERAQLYQAKMESWYDKIKEIQEVAEAKLFVALKDGRIHSFGKKLVGPTVEEHMNLVDENIGLHDIEHTEIPASFWRNGGIEWDDSIARSQSIAYVHIYVNTEELFTIFPPPGETSTKAVKVVAGNYVLDSDETGRVVAQSRAGRPSHNWCQFHVEVHRRFSKNAVPEKQEAFIKEMQDWCKMQWGVDVGRSTILEKVKPYYDYRGR